MTQDASGHDSPPQQPDRMPGLRSGICAHSVPLSRRCGDCELGTPPLGQRRAPNSIVNAARAIERAVEPPLPVDAGRCQCGHYHGQTEDQDDAGCNGGCTDDHQWSASVPLPADPDSIDDAMQYAIAYMNDPEGLAASREEWRDNLRAALHAYRASVPLPVDGLREALREVVEWFDNDNVVPPFHAIERLAATLAAPTPTAPPALDVERLTDLLQRIDGNHGAFVSRVHAERLLPLLSGTEPGKPTALSRTDSPRCDECGRVGYIVGVGADLRIGGHLDQRVKHPFRSGTDNNDRSRE